MPQHTASPRLRWSLLAAPVAGVLILAGCSAGSDGGSSGGDAAGEGFSIMVAQANDQDDTYAQTVDAWSKETGIPAEHMLICSTHTHSAPPSNTLEGPAPAVAYRKLLVKGLADGLIPPLR